MHARQPSGMQRRSAVPFSFFGVAIVSFAVINFALLAAISSRISSISLDKRTERLQNIHRSLAASSANESVSEEAPRLHLTAGGDHFTADGARPRPEVPLVPSDSTHSLDAGLETSTQRKKNQELGLAAD
eukprot:1263250-Rhodomonas_salina.1